MINNIRQIYFKAGDAVASQPVHAWVVYLAIALEWIPCMEIIITRRHVSRR